MYFHHFLQISCTGYGGRVTSSRDPIVIKIYFRGLHADNMTKKNCFEKYQFFLVENFAQTFLQNVLIFVGFCLISLLFPFII